MFTVMTSKKSITKGNYTYSLMGAGTEPTHVHINNDVTNTNSVIVPINDLMALFNPDENEKIKCSCVGGCLKADSFLQDNKTKLPEGVYCSIKEE